VQGIGQNHLQSKMHDISASNLQVPASQDNIVTTRKCRAVGNNRYERNNNRTVTIITMMMMMTM